eukprot:CAMPEP_0196597054 /NCGR_PEP_ID=MMETSP1081-20130531/89300_1 /TAXON_ID=36882 /ORGANISM="Pyramimonas amylifera, Strain CCMP720" /LENGTH=479 /DNA_ID=CAMNT_0041922309 /DNA_START=300 /DNA_END=1739 /DNA_ORIENTATION=-
MPSHKHKSNALLCSGQKVYLKNKWYIVEGKRVGKGQFAEVYRAKEYVSSTSSSEETEVALKIEREDTNLHYEYKVLKALQGEVDAVCRVFDLDTAYGVDVGVDRRVVVMQLLGENLSVLRKGKASQKIPWEVAKALGAQMLLALSQMHGVGYIHRDVKPSNFALGRAELGDSKLYIIDFGLARKYIDKGSHQPARENRRFRGSSAYASVNAHKEQDLSRRDDLWSLLYVLVEFIQGDLPWRKSCLDSEKDAILRVKQECMDNPELLSMNCRLPDVIFHFSNYLSSLDFETEPNYDYIQEFLGSPALGTPWEAEFALQRHLPCLERRPSSSPCSYGYCTPGHGSAQAGTILDTLNDRHFDNEQSQGCIQDCQHTPGNGCTAGASALNNESEAQLNVAKFYASKFLANSTLQANGVHVLQELLQLDPAQALTVIASTLNTIAESQKSNTGAGFWLQDIAAFALRLSQQSDGDNQSKRQKIV